MEEIDRLRRQLLVVMKVSAETERTWGSSLAGLERQFQEIIRRHDGDPVDLGEYDISKVVAEFRASKHIETQRHFIEICRSASYRLSDGWCLMDSAQHVQALGTYVAGIQRTSQKQKALRELLFPYLNYVALASGEKPQPSANFTRILRKLYTDISKDAQYHSPWFHGDPDRNLDGFRMDKNILSDNPAEEYLAALIDGRTADVDALFERRSIPANSWFIHGMLCSLMSNLAKQEDEIFKRGMNHALGWMQQQAELAKNDNARVDALAIALSRYARCNNRVEHPVLQKLSLRLIGNPWVNADRWAALVRKNDKPDEDARKMVDGWLKRTLINDFYSILQQDNATDDRRLKYWLRFHKYIDDMWFALDETLYDSKRQPYVEFRDRAVGRLSIIGRGNGASAFVMLIGGYYFVEFSQMNNRCFVYQKRVLESLVGMDFFSGRSEKRVDMKQLKDMHNSSLHPSHNGDWFRHFDEKFEEIIPHVMAHLPVVG